MSNTCEVCICFTFEVSVKFFKALFDLFIKLMPIFFNKSFNVSSVKKKQEEYNIIGSTLWWWISLIRSSLLSSPQSFTPSWLIEGVNRCLPATNYARSGQDVYHSNEFRSAEPRRDVGKGNAGEPRLWRLGWWWECSSKVLTQRERREWRRRYKQASFTPPPLSFLLLIAIPLTSPKAPRCSSRMAMIPRYCYAIRSRSVATASNKIGLKATFT